MRFASMSSDESVGAIAVWLPEFNSFRTPACPFGGAPLPSGIGPEPTDRTPPVAGFFYNPGGDAVMRLVHESRDTLVSVMVAVCLMSGIGGIVFSALGPDGWLLDLLRTNVQDPSAASLGSLAAVIAGAYLLKRLLDRGKNSVGLNNLLVGAVAVAGLAFLLQALHAAFF
jgi:hypothetical protein